MDTETLMIGSLSKSDIDYGCYKGPSADLLSQWLNSLETRSSWFWLHYIDADLSADEAEHEKRANSLESTDGTLSDTDGENIDDGDGHDQNVDDVFCPPCRSIAHRESDLLVALTENCPLGPVCYFCRYATLSLGLFL